MIKMHTLITSVSIEVIRAFTFEGLVPLMTCATVLTWVGIAGQWSFV